MELKGDKLKILANNPKLAQVLRDDLDKQAKIQGQGKTLKIKNILQHLPESAVPLVGNIMTGNPIFMGVGIFSFMAGGKGGVKEQEAFSEQRNKMVDVVKKNKELLGIEFPAAKGLNFLKEKMLESEAELEALKQLEEKILQNEVNDKDSEEIKREFQKCKEEQMEKYKNTEYKEEQVEEYRSQMSKDFSVKGLGYYTGSAFAQSFSYDKSREIFAALTPYNEARQTGLRRDISVANGEIAGDTRQLDSDKTEKMKSVHHTETYLKSKKEQEQACMMGGHS